MTVKVKKKKMTISEPEPKIPIEKLAETVSPAIWPPLFGESGKFENEAITYFHRIHCRECQRMEEEKRQEAGPDGGGGVPPTPTATPAQEAAILGGIIGDLLEDQSIHDTMDKNKESLKRKLLLRRSVTELVDQGIYPPLKTPVAFAEQRKHLERAKTGDLLRQKLKMRPDRQSLVQHHILEDTNVDPSLQDRQKLLKKARLQDSLNDRLANRPGPLELVQGNILEADPGLTDAIKEGKLQFIKTSELADGHINLDDPEDGSLSEGVLSPSSISESEQASPMTIPTPPDITPLLATLNQTGMMSPPPPTQTVTFSQISSPTLIASPPLTMVSPSTGELRLATSALSPPAMSSSSSTSSSSSGSSSSANIRLARLKKQKSKNPSKSRVIKFHEYKGPPSLVKSQPCMSPPPPPPPTLAVPAATATITAGGDTPYNILLQQQQLLLQWQLEMRQTKNMPIFLSTGQKQVLTAATASATATEGAPIIQQVQLQQVAPPPNSSGQKPVAIKTIMTPVGTPIPVSRPSPAATPVVMTTTHKASIPAAVPAHAIPTARPLATAVTNSMVVTTATAAMAVTASISKPTGDKDSSSFSRVNSNSVSSSNVNRVNNNSVSRTSTNNNNMRPPITKLDDLKVAELKAECKKRNLPVSGPKPNLLEKLKPFADEIVLNWQAHQNAQLRPHSNATSVSSCGSNSFSHINDNSLTSPASVQSITSLNHMILPPLTPPNDDAMSLTLGSPPMSPENTLHDSASPPQVMSPETMEVTSPTSIHPSHRITKDNQPMLIDPLSRPPSVIPMEMESNIGHINLNHSIGTDFNMNQKLSKSHKSVKTSTVISPPAPALPPPRPPPAPPLPPQVITIRPTQSTQSPGQIQIHTPGQFQVAAGTLQNPTLSSQIRAQLIQQITGQVVRLPTSSSTTAQAAVVSKVATAVNGQSAASVQPRQVLTQVVTPGRTVLQRPLVQISSPQTVTTSTASQLITTIQNQQALVTVPTTQQQPVIGQPPVISNEELVKQQQKQIEELRRQLVQYQLHLNEAQQKANAHSEQLQIHLAQAQVQGPDQAKAQQQAQLQAQALAHAQAQVQAIQQQAQIQVQAAKTLKTTANATAVAGSAMITTSPAQRVTPSPSIGGSPLKAMNPSPITAITASPGHAPTPSPAQMMAPSPVQSVMAPSPVQIIAPSPVPMIAPSPSPMAIPQTPSPKTMVPTTTARVPPAPVLQSLPQTFVIQQTTSPVLAQSTATSKPVTTVPLLPGQTIQHMGHKLILPNGQQVIISSQPQGMLVHTTPPKTIATTTNKPGKAAIVQLNGVNTALNKSSSVPSSPVGHSKVVRSNTNPFFTVPLREPPKYDEAIKNKQNVMLLQPRLVSSSCDTSVTMATSATMTSKSTTATTAATLSSDIAMTLATMKSENLDDVLDILIRNGELPATAAQEPPPTPKMSTATSKSGATNQLVSSPGQLVYNPDFQATLATMATTYPPPDTTATMSVADTVMSIANGLKMSAPVSGDAGSTSSLLHMAHGSPSLASSSSNHGSPLYNHASPLYNHASPTDSGVSSENRKDALLGLSPALSEPRKDALPALGLSPAMSQPDAQMMDLPFMEWSDSDFQDSLLEGGGGGGPGDIDIGMDTDDKDLIRELNKPAASDDLSVDDFFCVATIPDNLSNSHQVAVVPTPTATTTTAVTNHSSPNLRELGFSDMDVMDPSADMNMDVSDWLDVVMPPSGLTPTTVAPPATTAFSSDPILTPKTEEFLDLFNLVESDLCAAVPDHGPSGLCFENSGIMEASTSKS